MHTHSSHHTLGMHPVHKVARDATGYSSVKNMDSKILAVLLTSFVVWGIYVITVAALPAKYGDEEVNPTSSSKTITVLNQNKLAIPHLKHKIIIDTVN